MKKTAKILIIVLVIALAAGGGLFAWSRLKPVFSIMQGPVTIEAGQAFTPADFVTSMENVKQNKLAISLVKENGPNEAPRLDEEIVLDHPGVYYLYFVRNRRQEENIEIDIADTKAPAVSVPERVEFSEGDTRFALPAEVPEPFISTEDITELTASLCIFTEIENEERAEVVRLDDLSDESVKAAILGLKTGSYTAVVTATDEGNNTSEASFAISVLPRDVEAPVISGAGNVSISVGEEFDPQKGVTVKDNLDPAPRLTIDSSQLNTAKIGKYTVTYTAEDASGNQAVVKRTVKVVSGPVIFYPSDNKKASWDAAGIDGQPYLVAVNRIMNCVTVYGKDDSGNYTKAVKAFACSTGKPGDETPLGRWETTSRYSWCRMVDNSYGRYAIRIYKGWMFHSVCYFEKNKINTLEYEEYNKLGDFASLGCVRLCVRDIKWLYDNCPKGFVTVIYDDATSPGPLGKPGTIKIDVTDEERRGWDPTDPDSANPWK